MNTNLNKFIGEKIKFIDIEKNEYFLKDAMINTKNKNIFGRDLDIDFNNNLFGNDKNDPRLNARSIKIKEDFSSMKKGVLQHVIMIMIVLGVFMQRKLSMTKKRRLLNIKMPG